MRISMGERIRELRRRDGRTQDALAAALGVTAQAVSRWEANGGYPDTELLPSVANYFHITIDELFGYDSDRKLRVDAILESVKKRKADGEKHTDIVPSLREAVAEFPDEEALTFELADSLWHMAWESRGMRSYNAAGDIYVHVDAEWNSKNEPMQESMAMLERLASGARDDKIKLYSKQILVSIYWETGRFDEGEKLAETFAELSVSKENMLYHATDGEKGCRYAQLAMLASLDSLAEALGRSISIRMPTTVNKSTEEILAYYITQYEKKRGLLAMYELIFDDGDFGWRHEKASELNMELASLCGHIMRSMDKLNDARRSEYMDKAFGHLDAGLHHARKFDALPKTGEHKFSAYLVDHVAEDTDKWQPSDSASRLADSWALFDLIKRIFETDERWERWLSEVRG